ncbi:hypothetical protein BD410DRAFT_783757 [Rickenella mellea]|uniref:Uncharacterized protein n=1 Tax=Rickenella mellea TaxID=50990 RepID=A0A4Y7QG89_9AGAM|nr:hypothetical protein BD410DRAFT_783757 [Rickenella mellea]
MEKADPEGREKSKLAANRGNKYKEKFHALRTRYDNVTSKHEEYRRELEQADAQLKKLQAENDLLLDAMSIAALGQPTLLQYLISPIPEPPPYQNGHGNGLTHSHREQRTNGVNSSEGGHDFNPHPRLLDERDGHLHPDHEYHDSREPNGRSA